MEYLLHLLILAGIYIMLSQSLCLPISYGGMISLAHAGFYGIGAYTTALLSVNYQLPFLLNLPIAIILSGILALVVSIVALRTVDQYFIVCTMGIQVIIFSLLHNWVSVTRGSFGISGIPGIQIFGIGIENKLTFLFLTLFFVALVFFFLKKLTSSSFGRTLRALSEDEIFTQSLGKNVYLTKVIAFTLSAMIAAIPGSLYAHYIRYIDPTSFTIDESIFILSIVIIGGKSKLWGCIIASIILVFLPEGLRFVGVQGAVAANIRQIIYGAMLIIMMFIDSREIKMQKVSNV